MGISRLVDVEAGVGDAGEPDERRRGPGLGRDGVRARSGRSSVSAAASAASVHSRSSTSISTSGCSRRRSARPAPGTARAPARGRSRRGDAPVDVDLASIGHHVGGAAAGDQRGVHRGPAGERVLEVGEHLGQPQQEPRHRGDRVHPSMRLRAVGGLPEGGRGEPGAASFGEPELQLARLADDARVLVEQAALPQHLRAVDAGELLVGGEVEHERAASVDPRPTERRGRRERRRDRPLHVGRAAPDEPSVVDRSPAHGSRRPGVGRAGRHDVEVAVPRQARAGRRPRSRRPRWGGPRRSARSAGSAPSPREDRRTATSAASSSVPPGFSLRAAISARAKRERPRPDRRPRRRPRPGSTAHLPWRAMLPPDDLAGALQAALEPRSPTRAGGRATGSPRCWRRCASSPSRP